MLMAEDVLDTDRRHARVVEQRIVHHSGCEWPRGTPFT